MNDVECRVGVMLRGVRVSGSAFISSMKILVIVFVLSHSSPRQATTCQEIETEIWFNISCLWTG